MLRFQGAPGPQRDPVEALRLPHVQTDEAAHDGVRHIGNIHRHDLRDRCFHMRCAGNGFELALQRQRCPLERGKHVSKARLGVVQVTRPGQGVVGREAGDKSRHPAGHHQCDGDGLTPHQAQIAQQFAVEGLHQDSSLGLSLWALVSTRWMRPPPRDRMRSAMPAMAALWVMTMVVVPSSRLMRSMTSSTSLPVT